MQPTPFSDLQSRVARLFLAALRTWDIVVPIVELSRGRNIMITGKLKALSSLADSDLSVTEEATYCQWSPTESRPSLGHTVHDIASLRQ